MLKSNWPYLVNLVILIGYFSMRTGPATAWPQTLIVWAWLPYLVHLYVHNFVDGFQNTTRNIARIYLLETQGKEYEPGRVAPLQIALVPRSMVPVTLIWFAAHIVSFTVLLFFQGWATALVAEGFIIGFGWVFPINYPGHMQRIQKHLQAPDASTSSTLAADDLAGVTAIVDRAVRENRNPQEWWASFYH